MDYPARQFTRSVLWHLVTLGLLTITLLVCCSCSSTKHVTQVVEHVSKDTIYLSNYQYDSVYVFKYKVTDYSRDTIYIREIQTEYKYRILRDTVLKVQHDSIPYEVTKTVTKEITRPLTPFDQLCRTCFYFLVGVLFVLFVRFVFNLKSKLRI